jgi:CubicO group peptidase (beta-lactamase class C family)
MELLAAEPLAYEPGKGRLYSDLDFMVLGNIIERVCQRGLDRFFSRAVCAPLGINELLFLPLEDENGPGPAAKNISDVAATEECPCRGRVLLGEVHDKNAHALLGVSGHSGLFGTARGVFLLVSEFLAAYRGSTKAALFAPETARTFLLRQGPPGSFALGFDTPSRPDSSSGRFFSDNTVGHLGFTGTSFWADLEKDVVVVLLTNRVHPDGANEKIKGFRPVIHDAVMRALGAC